MTYVLTTPLGQQPLLCRMKTTEALSQPFLFELSVLSRQPELDRAALLGKTMTVSLATPTETGGVRHFHGYVTEFRSEFRGYVEDQQDVQREPYTITMRPWLWFLTLSRGCRIFQNKSVPEIVKEVCAAHGFGNVVELSLVGDFPPLLYCVQYNESDFAFISRLLEREGIYYYFEHEKSEHKLVLANHPEAHKLRDENRELPHRPLTFWGHDYIQAWRETHQVRSLSYTLDDYDFTRPVQNLKTGLEAQAESEPYAYPNGKQFEYPGDYLEVARGQHYVGCRLHEQNARSAYVSGSASLHGLLPGAAFTTSLKPAAEYLVLSTCTEIEIHDYHDVLPDEQRVDETPSRVQCEFVAQEKKTSYRPARVTTKPSIPGVQTATVVGGEPGTIQTDLYGRVRVRFPWFDRTKPDQEQSCFVRVAQLWAGNGWGSIFVPRVGDEVVVSFVGGDPDQPLIVGSVYNGLVEPPFELPGKAAVSGLRTQKLDGDKSAELWFNDASGAVDMKGINIGLAALMGIGLNAAGALAQVELSTTGGVTIMGTQLALQCGAGKIEMMPTGAIEISGAPVLINGLPIPGANPVNVLGPKNVIEVAQAVAKAAAT